METENYIHNRHDGAVMGADDAPLVGSTPHSKNEHYYVRAVKAIKARGDKLGIHDIADTEDEMKQLLMLILDIDEDQAEILYEIIERAIGCHWKKVHRM